MRDRLHLRLKTWLSTCNKEYPYCFCNEICFKTTLRSITKYTYEYLTCDKDKCDYLEVRCTNCWKLCNIFVSNNGSKLFWGCKNNNSQCQFFKQNVLKSLRNHINSCRNVVSINEDILCRLILWYMDNLEFINILKKLYTFGKLNKIALNKIKNYLSDRSPQIVSVIDNEILSLTTPSRSVTYETIDTLNH